VLSGGLETAADYGLFGALLVGNALALFFGHEYRP
jgi:hypothetical protein